MKSFLNKAFRFMIIALFVYPTGVVLYGHFISGLEFAPSIERLRFKEAKTVSNVDILCLGSSHAARGFDPRVFEAQGINLFNLGSDAQTPMNTLAVTERYLKKVRPKMVIYEVNPLSFFVATQLESSIGIMKNDDPDIFPIRHLMEHKSPQLFHAWIYSLARSKIALLEKDPVVNVVDQYVKGGYIEKTKCPFSGKRLFLDYKKVNKTQWTAFSKAVKLIRDEDIPIVFVSTPILPEYVEGYGEADLIFKEFIAHYQPYYDFSELMDAGSTDYFCDAHHLNQQGVEVFNHKLLEVLDLLK